MALTSTTVDVTTVRWLDGHRIERKHERLTHGEVMVLKVQEQCLPGVLAAFVQKPTPRPWEEDTATT